MRTDATGRMSRQAVTGVMQTFRQQRETEYQRRSRDRLSGAGDHIGLVVYLEGQTDKADRAEVSRLSVQTADLQAAAAGKVKTSAEEDRGERERDGPSVFIRRGTNGPEGRKYK